MSSEQNPYAPPQAPVADVGDARPAEKPRQVVLAVQLLWAMLALGAVNSAVQWPRLTESVSLGMVLSVQLVTLAVIGGLTIMISRGRNWARIVYLVLFLIGVPGFVVQMPGLFAYSVLAGLLSAAQGLAQVVAMLLVFTEPGRRWYRR
jgi:hypothetical protein